MFNSLSKIKTKIVQWFINFQNKKVDLQAMLKPIKIQGISTWIEQGIDLGWVIEDQKTGSCDYYNFNAKLAGLISCTLGWEIKKYSSVRIDNWKVKNFYMGKCLFSQRRNLANPIT